VTVLADGRTAEGERWTLRTEQTPLGRSIAVDVAAADGRPWWGTGCLLAELGDGEALDVTTGSDDTGPSVLILQLSPAVRAVVVRLSDGTREDLRLHPLPGRDDRVAILVHPRTLDVHRIDLYDARGAVVGEPTTGPTAS
jgi:hypothetical protein